MSTSYRDFQTNEVGNSGLSKDIYPIIDSNGDWRVLTGKDAIICSIRNLLMTPLGKYPFDPNYGSLLYKQLFEPQDDQTSDNIKYEVKDRVEQFENRVTVDEVIVNMKDKTARVDVVFTIKDEVNKTKLSIEMKELNSGMLYEGDQSMGTSTTSIWS